MCAVVATMGLGVTAGVVAKNLSAPAAIPTHIVQGQGGSLQLSGHRGGVQSIDDTLPTTQLAPDPALGYDISGFTSGASAPTTQLAASARAANPHGYI